MTKRRVVDSRDDSRGSCALVDDLNAPLGQDKRKRLPTLPVSAPQLVAGILGVSGLVVVAWAAFVSDPLGGEPTAIVATKAPPSAQTARDGDADAKQHARHDGLASSPPATPDAAVKTVEPPPPGSKTVTIIDGSSGTRKEYTIPGGGDGGSQRPLLDPKLIEGTRHGAIPKVGPDGARPSSRYAHARELPAGKKDSPIIAIVIGGLGISASGTADAFAKLPASVTFALAPYGADLEKLADRARADAHELLLQAPMEPFEYPDNNPGPQTLLTSLPADQDIDRLHWAMSRIQGYVGIGNYMGARFTANEAAVTGMLREVGKRGLVYFDDGSSSRSITAQAAVANGVPYGKADLVID